MANEKIPSLTKLKKITWATFLAPGVRVHSNGPLVSALVTDGEFDLWFADFCGVPVLAIESKEAVSPARIPLSACSGFGE